MKKNSVILRIACLCFAMLLLLAVPAGAAGGPEFRLDGPTGPVKAGEEFDVTVELVGNPGFRSLEFILGFDHTVLDCIGLEYGELTLFAASAENLSHDDGAAVAIASAETVSGDGVVAILHFHVAADLDSVVFSLPKGIMYDQTGTSCAIGFNAPSVPVIVTPTPDPVTPDPVDQEPEDGDTTPDPGEDTQTVVPSFTDIDGHWGLEFILKAAEKSLFKGYEDGRFGPNDPVTRAQFVTVLYRMAGSPEISGSVPFADTAELIEEFKKAISWAYGNGYVNGRSETVFDPGGRITRQEAMKILFAYSGGVSGMEAMFTGIYDDAYSDSGDIASWAKSAMYWGVYHELIKGMGDGVIAPLGTATRAQLAKILVVYSEKF